eukprot:359459-Chlamydomonas_euryale.AAC.7
MPDVLNCLCTRLQQRFSSKFGGVNQVTPDYARLAPPLLNWRNWSGQVWATPGLKYAPHPCAIRYAHTNTCSQPWSYHARAVATCHC